MSKITSKINKIDYYTPLEPPKWAQGPLSWTKLCPCLQKITDRANLGSFKQSLTYLWGARGIRLVGLDNFDAIFYLS